MWQRNLSLSGNPKFRATVKRTVFQFLQTQDENEEDNGNGNSITAPLIGGILGGVVFIGFVIWLIWYLRRRRALQAEKQRREAMRQMSASDQVHVANPIRGDEQSNSSKQSIWDLDESQDDDAPVLPMSVDKHREYMRSKASGKLKSPHEFSRKSFYVAPKKEKV